MFNRKYIYPKEYLEELKRDKNGNILVWRIQVLNIIDTSLLFVSYEDACTFKNFIYSFYPDKDKELIKVLSEPYIFTIEIPITVNLQETIKSKKDIVFNSFIINN